METSLKDLVDHVDGSLARLEDGDGPVSPSGHTYITLMSNGVKAEGSPVSKHYRSRAGAIKAWTRNFDKLVKAKNATEVSWRVYPQLVWHPGQYKGYIVRARLAVS